MALCSACKKPFDKAEADKSKMEVRPVVTKAGAAMGTIDIVRYGALGPVKFFLGVISKGDGNFFIQQYNGGIEKGQCIDCAKFWAYQTCK